IRADLPRWVNPARPRGTNRPNEDAEGKKQPPAARGRPTSGSRPIGGYDPSTSLTNCSDVRLVGRIKSVKISRKSKNLLLAGNLGRIWKSITTKGLCRSLQSPII